MKSVGVLAAAVLINAQAIAQCDAVWEPVSQSNVNGEVLALTRWDPAGPQPAVLVAGGSFWNAGGATSPGIAYWADGAWHSLGQGFRRGTDVGAVNALAVLNDGSLVAGGYIATSGGVPVNGIARWDGTAWQSLGGGFTLTGVGSPYAQALAVLPNGDLIAAGIFDAAGGVPARNIARWNGISWSALGDGLNGEVLALTGTSNGDLIAGGQFTMSGQVDVNSIARWDGTTWSPLGTGIQPSQFARTVRSLAKLPNGDIVAGGTFVSAGGVATSGAVARWDGSQWNSMGGGISVGGGFASVRSLPVLNDGTLVAMGDFTSNNTVWRWDGTRWYSMNAGAGGASTPVTSIVMPNGDLIVGGGFTALGGLPTPSHIAVFGSPCRCDADLDNGAGFGSPNSERDNAVTIDDLLYFLAAFEAGDQSADLDDGSGTGTPDGAADIEDLLYFLTHFEAGC